MITHLVYAAWLSSCSTARGVVVAAVTEAAVARLPVSGADAIGVAGGEEERIAHGEEPDRLLAAAAVLLPAGGLLATAILNPGSWPQLLAVFVVAVFAAAIILVIP